MSSTCGLVSGGRLYRECLALDGTRSGLGVFEAEHQDTRPVYSAPKGGFVLYPWRRLGRASGCLRRELARRCQDRRGVSLPVRFARASNLFFHKHF